MRRNPWVIPAAVAFGGIFLALVVTIVLKVRTKEGTIVLENVPTQAEVFVDGEKVTVHSPDLGGTVEVTVPAGRRGVQVQKQGFRAFGEEVTVTAGETAEIRVRLVALGEPDSKLKDAPVGIDSLPQDAPIRGNEPNPWPEALALEGLDLPFNARIVTISRDGRLLAQKSPEIPLRIFRSPDAFGFVDTEHLGGAWGATFSPDGRFLASHGDGQPFRISNTATGKEVRRISFDGRVVRVAYSADGKRLVGVTHGGRGFLIWDATTGALQQALTGHSDREWSAMFSPDGTRLATCAGPWEEAQESPGEVKLWDLRDGSCKDLAGHKMRASDVAFSPDGRYVVSTGFDRTAKVWDVATLQCVSTFDKHQGYVDSARFSPDGRLVASIGRENLVRVWEPATGHEVAAFAHRWSDPKVVGFSPDGRWIFAAAGRTLKSWETPGYSKTQAAAPLGLTITNSPETSASGNTDGAAGTVKNTVQAPQSSSSASPSDARQRGFTAGGVEVGRAPAGNPQAQHDARLIVFYGFDDGKAVDLSGNAHHGTYSREPPTPTSGPDGTVLSFSPARENSVSIPVNINPDVMPRVTMGGWFNPRRDNFACTLISHDDGGFDRTLNIDRRGQRSSRPRWAAFDGRGVISLADEVVGKWSFVAMRHDQTTGELIVEVEGTRVTRKGVKYSQGKPRVFIGRNPGFVGSYFDGLADNVFIFDGILSDARVDEIRTKGRAAILARER